MVLFQRRRTENLQATTDDSLKTEIPFDNSSTIVNNKKLLFSFLILFRLFNALVTKTYFNPDEYWQSVEVAHYMIYAPRLLQAFFAAINDFYSYRLAKKLFNDSSAKWTGLLVVLTTLIPFVVIGIYSARKNSRYWIRIKPLLQLCIWVLLCYSLLGHKEFRFIYPLLPIFVVISGIGIDEISSIKNSYLENSFTSSKKSAWLKFSIIFL
ncbi:20301_t:CDS:2, partial [Gigaspora rosea]